MENQVLDKGTAERLVQEIRVMDAELWGKMMDLYEGRAWIALGFSSWGELCDTEFKANNFRIPREDRREVVMSMRERGMSTRAIAAATNMSPRTVRREVDASGANAPVEITGENGKTYRVGQSAATQEATAKQKKDSENFQRMMEARGESPEQKHAREHKFYDDLHKVTRLLADLSTRASDEPTLPDNITYFIESARQSLDTIAAVKDGVTITDDQIMAELLGGNNA
ncbi:helix-turn-helix domain-containing protein [Corynebacterium kalidii]